MNVTLFQVETVVFSATEIRILMHKAREHQQPLYICFVDFKIQHTDFNEDTTDEGASVACSNIRL